MRKPVTLIRVIRWLLLINLVLAASARGLGVTYYYEGNYFVEFDGTENLFSTEDRVTARFLVDCALAHAAGDCRNLPYVDYAQQGAVQLQPFAFTAGPAKLPTADGGININRFAFSTDADARIVDWDIDLYSADQPPSINVDTDNVDEGLDSAAVPGAGAVVRGQPGSWEYDLPPPPGGFDLQVRKTVDNPAPAGPGQTVEFTVEVTNNGTIAVSDVAVEDKLPVDLAIPEGMAAYTSSGTYDPVSGRWMVGTVDPGAPAEVMTIPVIIKTVPQPVCVLNTARADMPGDTNADNNESLAILRRADVERCVDLGVKLLAWYSHPYECSASGEIRYQLEIANAGPDSARNVVVNIVQTQYQAPGFSVRFPAACEGLSCSWEMLDPGQTVMVDVSSDLFQVQEAKEHAIEVSVSSDVPDYRPEDNILLDQHTVQPFPETPCNLPSGGAGGFGNLNIGGGCFIATAIYGSPSHPNVEILRAFRDQVLLQTQWGRAVVDYYYRHSPALAGYITEHGFLRSLLRALLVPVVWVISFPWLALSALFAVAICLVLVWRRRAA